MADQIPATQPALPLSPTVPDGEALKEPSGGTFVARRESTRRAALAAALIVAGTFVMARPPAQPAPGQRAALAA
jgi:hypothetical protein